MLIEQKESPTRAWPIQHPDGSWWLLREPVSEGMRWPTDGPYASREAAIAAAGLGEGLEK